MTCQQMMDAEDTVVKTVSNVSQVMVWGNMEQKLCYVFEKLH